MKPTLQDRMKKEVGHAAPSMIPAYKIPPPQKEDEEIPDLQELVSSTHDRQELASLIELHFELGRAEKEAKKAKVPVTEKIKHLLGEYQINKCLCAGVLVNYFNSPRSTLSRDKLLEHGVSPKIIEACTVVKDVYTLRVGGKGEVDKDE